jgi:site-specific DNA recombinase
MRKRNPHRSKRAWTLGAVRTILVNPRYTGRQVWNRQPSAYDLIDPANTGLGHRQTHRRIQPDGWVISTRPAHAALVSEADFIAAQNIRAPRGDPGLLRCGICGRRMESCWANSQAAYRCRHGNTSASAPDPARPKNLYIREDRILPTCPPSTSFLNGTDPPSGSSLPTATEVISHLREREIALIYEPETRTLWTNTSQEVKITIDSVR